MCKLMIIPNVKNTHNVRKFLKASKPGMVKGDKDGIGYAAVTSSGALAIERWLDPKDAFKAPKDLAADEQQALDPLLSLLEPSTSEYTAEGPLNEAWKAVVYHSRYATCTKSMQNVHPFTSGETALIHNGVISNPDAFGARNSTCDSESLLNGYIQNSVQDDLGNFQSVSTKLEGYFALGILSKTSLGVSILDIVKDDRASLYTCYIPKLGSMVFCTSASIIAAACKALKWRHGSFHKVKNNTAFRYDVMSGKLIDSISFDRPLFTVKEEPSVLAKALSEETLDSDWDKSYSARERRFDLDQWQTADRCDSKGAYEWIDNELIPRKGY